MLGLSKQQAIKKKNITKYIKLNEDPDNNVVYFTMMYAITETNIEDTVVINFEQ